VRDNGAIGQFYLRTLYKLAERVGFLKNTPRKSPYFERLRRKPLPLSVFGFASGFLRLVHSPHLAPPDNTMSHEMSLASSPLVGRALPLSGG